MSDKMTQFAKAAEEWDAAFEKRDAHVADQFRKQARSFREKAAAAVREGRHAEAVGFERRAKEAEAEARHYER